MLGFITSKISSAATPYIMGGVAVVLFTLLATIGVLKWQNKGLETELAQAQQKIAEVRVSLETCRAGVAALEHSVQRQNERIESLQREAQVEAREDIVRGTEVLERERRRELPQGHGPEVMNQWFAEVASP